MLPNGLDAARRVVSRVGLVRPTASGVLAFASPNSIVAQSAPTSSWQGTPPATAGQALRQRTVAPSGGENAVTPTTSSDGAAGSGAMPSVTTVEAGAAVVGGMSPLIKIALFAAAAFVVWKVVKA